MRRTLIGGGVILLLQVGCAAVKPVAPAPASVTGNPAARTPQTVNQTTQEVVVGPAKSPDAMPIPEQPSAPAHAGNLDVHAPAANTTGMQNAGTVVASSDGSTSVRKPVYKAPRTPSGSARHPEASTAAAVPSTRPAVAGDSAKQAMPPALDFSSLQQRLRDTRAIGVFTKLSLKNQVDDLLAAFKAYYRGTLKVPLAELRQRYDLLLLKVLTLLQDGDPPLAATITTSKEAIWGILADPQKFASL